MVGTNLEAPAFIPDQNLSRTLEKAANGDPRLIIPLIERSVIDGSLEKQTGHKINIATLGRRRFMQLTVAATGALILPGIAFAQEEPWHSSQYFPISKEVAGHEHLLTLDEIGGPLHIYDIAEDLIYGYKTNVRGWWEANITLPILRSLEGSPQKLADAGYCSELAATQIWIPKPASSKWIPNEYLKKRPDIADKNPDYGIEDTTIIGLNVARFAGGVAYRPVEVYERPADNQSDEVTQVLDQFIGDYQNLDLSIQDRLFLVEFKPNWYAKVDSISDDGNFLNIENFDHNPKIQTIKRTKAIWAHKPLSYEEALRRQKLGLYIPDRMMNERAPFRAPELRGIVIDFLGGNQLANSA